MRNSKIVLMIATATLLIWGAIGCSNQDSSNPLNSGKAWYNESAIAASPSEPVEIHARIQVMDQDRRMLMLEGCPDTCIANQNCQCVKFYNGSETPMAFGDLKPGDSVAVYGNRYQNQNQYIYLHKIACCFNQQGGYDVAFRDTIATIDYAAGSFTVKGRTEAILVDENTLIWGNVITGPNRSEDQGMRMLEIGVCGDTPGGPSRDTILTLLDLKEGDVVEVRANILENGSLLAVMIKVANCQAEICNQFDATLASVDADQNSVTFVDLNWLGLIGKGTRLLAADGSTLTLADFAIGEPVHVKGFPLVGDSLKICLLQKL